MSDSTAVDAQIRHFVDAVRAHLADLDPTQIEHLTAELDSDLREQAADTGKLRLPHPGQFANDLRAAADLPTEPMRPSRTGSTEQRRVPPGRQRLFLIAVAGFVAIVAVFALIWSFSSSSSSDVTVTATPTATPTASIAAGGALPDLVGLPVADASAMLSELGYIVTIVEQPATDPGQVSTVVAMSPAAGTLAARGDTIILTALIQP